MMRKFIWENEKTNAKKFHLINRIIVRSPKLNGGLGIRDPFPFNQALGAKIV